MIKLGRFVLMTEKRFELKLCSNGVYYVYKDNDLIIPYIDFDRFNNESAEEVVKLINELYDENGQLKEENEQLKQDLFIEQTDCKNQKESKGYWRNKAKELEEENEQLRKEIEEFKDVITDKVQYGEDNLEEFLIKKGIISEDWARFDGYD